MTLESFNPSYDPTLTDNSRKLCTIDSEAALLDLTPISINDKIAKRSYLEARVRTLPGVLILYSITSRASFDDTTSIHSLCCQIWPRSVVMLVGTKSDLEYERQVSKEEGEAMARRLECGFAEVSSKYGVNVQETVYDAVRVLKKNNVKAIVPSVEQMLAKPNFDGSIISESSVSEGETISEKKKTARNWKCIIL